MNSLKCGIDVWWVGLTLGHYVLVCVGEQNLHWLSTSQCIKLEVRPHFKRRPSHFTANRFFVESPTYPLDLSETTLLSNSVWLGVIH